MMVMRFVLSLTDCDCMFNYLFTLAYWFVDVDSLLCWSLGIGLGFA